MYKIFVALALSTVFMISCINHEKAKKSTVFLAGDSTMAHKKNNERPETGWGEKLIYFLDTSRVKVENHAKNGRSTKSFIEEGRWDSLLNKVSPGDYVFIQFGHNDESPKKVGRYTTPDQYRDNLRKFVVETREKNGNPILLTPVSRRSFDDEGVLYNSHGQYPNYVREVAAELNVPLLDITLKSELLLKELGRVASEELFLWGEAGELENYPDGVEDNTHFCDYGANKIAALVASEIREENISGLKGTLKRVE